MKLKVNDYAPNFHTEDVSGKAVHLQDYLGKKVYISFLRNTHCPMCSLHVFKLLKIVDSLKAKGLETLVFYESSKEMFQLSYFFREQVLRPNRICIISDTHRKIYELYGAEVSTVKGSLEAFMAAPGRMEQYKEAQKLGFTTDGKEQGTSPDAIPADFLLDENLKIAYAHYGNDSGDNISLTLVESFAINPASIL